MSSAEPLKPPTSKEQGKKPSEDTNLKRKIDELQEQIDYVIGDNKRLKKALDVEAQLNTVTAKINTTTAQNAALEGQITAIETKSVAIQEELSGMEAKNVDLRRKLSTLNEGHVP
jgi:chromosome segregation ATPase